MAQPWGLVIILLMKKCQRPEIAEELGVLDKVLEDGWKSLSAKETGRIGGLMTKRRREEKKKEENPEIS